MNTIQDELRTLAGRVAAGEVQASSRWDGDNFHVDVSTEFRLESHDGGDEA